AINLRAVEPCREGWKEVPSTVRGDWNSRRESIQKWGVIDDSAEDPAAKIGVLQPRSVEPNAVPNDPDREQGPEQKDGADRAGPKLARDFCTGLEGLKFCRRRAS